MPVSRTQALSYLCIYIPLLLYSIGSCKALPRIVVVNDMPTHFEVLTCILHVLRPHADRLTVYYTGNPNLPKRLELFNWTGGQIGTWKSYVSMQQKNQTMSPADVVICVTPELAPKICRHVLSETGAKKLIAWVHRADTFSANLLTLHRNMTMVALAPHVARLISKRMHRKVKWALPSAPYRPPRTCDGKNCPYGYAIQGAMRKYRNKNSAGFTRDYVDLWKELAELKAGKKMSKPFKVKVIGKGSREDLRIPKEINRDIEFYGNIPYPEFWSHIYNSTALVPAFGMDVYYSSRLSTTVMASLITGVPIIAEPRFLKTYRFLPPETVLPRNHNETEVEAMGRFAALPWSKQQGIRNMLLALRERLNKECLLMLESLWKHL